MKITRVECLPLRYPYDEAIYDASFKAAARQALLVRIHTDAGIAGIGEAASFGGPLTTTAHLINEELAPRLHGEDPFRVERIWRKLYHQSFQHGRGGVVICALSGIDIALWTSSAKRPARRCTSSWGDIAVRSRHTPAVGSTVEERILQRSLRR